MNPEPIAKTISFRQHPAKLAIAFREVNRVRVHADERFQRPFRARNRLDDFCLSTHLAAPPDAKATPCATDSIMFSSYLT